jgi:amylosucrase
VLAWHRKHPRSGNFIGLANFAEEPVDVPVTPLTGLGFLEPVLSSGDVDWRGDRWVLPPLGFLWLAER